MSISPQDIAYVEELFEPLGNVRHRKMVGQGTHSRIFDIGNDWIIEQIQTENSKG